MTRRSRRSKNWLHPNDPATVSMGFFKTVGVSFGRSGGVAGFGLVSPTRERGKRKGKTQSARFGAGAIALGKPPFESAAEV